jgi:hypothetical protein
VLPTLKHSTKKYYQYMCYPQQIIDNLETLAISWLPSSNSCQAIDTEQLIALRLAFVRFYGFHLMEAAI